MGMVPRPPTPNSPHAGLIDDILQKISSVPPSSLTVGLIQYLLQPVIQILRYHDPLALPDIFLESTFRFLTYIVNAWKAQERGIDIGSWEQLWRFTTASIAPRVVDAGKGKVKAVGQEVQLQAVNLLTALLGVGESHPRPEMLEKVSSASSPLISTLLQTITLLIEMVAPHPPHNQLQLASLRLLRTLVTTYLHGKHAILASVLPGTISSISKMLGAAAQTLKGDVAAQSAGFIEDIVTSTLRDADLVRIGVLRSGFDHLGQMAEEWDERGKEHEPAGTQEETLPDGRRNPFPPLTRSYLEFTSTQLLATLRPILSLLTTHASHVARQAASSLSFSLIDQCQQSLSQLVPHALSTLLLLSRDDFDLVRDHAQDELRRLVQTESTATLLDATLIDLLGEAVNSLRRLVVSHQERKVEISARLLVAIADVTSVRADHNPIAALLGSRGKVERWGWALLDCLEFGRPAGWSTVGSNTAKAAEKGWTGGLLTSSMPLLLEGEGAGGAAYSELPLRYVESETTVKAIRNVLTSLGAAGGEAALHAVEHFVHFAQANRTRDTSKAVSALWVAQLLLDGIAQGQENGPEGRTSKSTRKLAKEMTRIIVSIEEEEEEEDFEQSEQYQPMDVDDDTSLVPVERQRGLDVVTTLLDRPSRPGTRAAHETKRLQQQAQKAMLSAVALSTLSVTSRILSSSFRPLLLTVLYTLLSHLASPDNLVATYAETTLGHVAYNTGYASVQNLLLDNVDYVINVVSQRLNPSRLSPTAPLVLIAMIRMTRSEIVPMVHDIVDEIFDALDDFHGYEVLASGLLAVLVTLVDVMADDVAVQDPSPARLEKLQELDRLGRPPNPEVDFARFKAWWEERKVRREEEVTRILERAPEHAWGKDTTAKEGDEPDAEAPNPHDDAEPPATRSEEITKQILDKSLNFLSHRSPFLRAKILSLISRAIPVLAAGNREGDLLPLIDRSWGIILLRLDDPLPYVVTEAAEVIVNLCRHVGDFMSRKILQQAWPKLQKILKAQKSLDEKSALARRGAVGTSTQWSVSHRLHLAIVEIATFVASQVPVDEGVLWDMMVVFRPFIDQRAHEEIQEKAMVLYEALAVRDGDALWVVLNASLGRQGGVWEYLREDGLEIAANAERLLGGL